MDGNMDPASDKWTIKNVKEDFMEIYNICVGVEDKIFIIIFKHLWPPPCGHGIGKVFRLQFILLSS